GADPHHAGAPAAHPHHLSRPGVPQRQRPAALADVPPGGGPGGGGGHHRGSPQGDPPRLHAPPLRAGRGDPPAAELLPLHRALGRDGRLLPELQGQRVRRLLRQRLDGDPRLRHGGSARARRLRHRSGRLLRLRLRHGSRPGGHEPLRHPQHPPAVRQRRAAAAAGAELMEFSTRWLAEYVDLPEDPRDLQKRLTESGLHVEGLASHGGDTVLDVDVTSNRPDCMNHFGLAREVSVIYDRPLRRPPAAPAEAPERAADAARIVIEDLEGCPRFAARVVRGVGVGPSPAWLRERLESIGQRSINNVVDVTNFVLWELGQPLHAYDLAKVAGGTLMARRARAGERLVTLDGQERRLDPDVLVIADAE